MVNKFTDKNKYQAHSKPRGLLGPLSVMIAFMLSRFQPSYGDEAFVDNKSSVTAAQITDSTKVTHTEAVTETKEAITAPQSSSSH